MSRSNYPWSQRAWVVMAIRTLNQRDNFWWYSFSFWSVREVISTSGNNFWNISFQKYYKDIFLKFWNSLCEKLFLK